MTKMLNKQQAAAYLAAPTEDAMDSSMHMDAKHQQQPLHLSELRDPRQLQLLQESEEYCSSSAASSSAYEQHNAAAAVRSSSSTHPQQPGAAFPLVPQRVRAVSYGGVLPNAHAHELPAGSSCSDPGVGPSHDGAGTSRMGTGRRSLAVQTGGSGSDDAACYTEGDSSELYCQVPSSLSSPARMLAGRQYSYSSGGVPAAVAVIEMVGGAPALAMQQLDNGAVKVPVVGSATGAAAGAAAGAGVNGSRDGRTQGFATLEDLAMC
jgi:hypothetical protein